MTTTTATQAEKESNMSPTNRRLIHEQIISRTYAENDDDEDETTPIEEDDEDDNDDDNP